MTPETKAAAAGHPVIVDLPTPIIQRLLARAANAGLFTPGGKPDAFALRNRAIRALCDGGDTVQDAIQALVTDRHDPDMAEFMRACIAAAATRCPPRWPAHLADRLDLDTPTLLRLHLRAERDNHPVGVPDLATMASAALALAFNGTSPPDADLRNWIARHPDPLMRTLCQALERARAAGRPS